MIYVAFLPVRSRSIPAVPREGRCCDANRQRPSVRCQLIVAVSAYLPIRGYIDILCLAHPFTMRCRCQWTLKNIDVAHDDGPLGVVNSWVTTPFVAPHTPSG